MNHHELTYFRLHPEAYRVLASDDLICGEYHYLCRDKKEAEELQAHIKSKNFQRVRIERLGEEE